MRGGSVKTIRNIMRGEAAENWHQIFQQDTFILVQKTKVIVFPRSVQLSESGQMSNVAVVEGFSKVGCLVEASWYPCGLIRAVHMLVLVQFCTCTIT